MKLTTEFPEKFFKEEERSILISEDRKRLWAAQLDLLIEFDRVCKENEIKYSLDAGTLLGAVRHGGFIPWDDDIDVVMLREEYEKLNRIASDKFLNPYFWQTFKTDPDHGRGFARLRNSSTTYILHSEQNNKKPCFSHNQGVFIDVFIADAVPDNEIERIRFMGDITSLQARAWIIRMQGANNRFLKTLLTPWELYRKMIWLFCYKLIHVDVVTRLRNRIDHMSQKYNAVGSRCISRLTFTADRKSRLSACVPKYYLDELTTVEFEGRKFLATKYWDEYLTVFYGNWHRHVIAHDPSGGAFIDLDNSYTKYIQ